MPKKQKQRLARKPTLTWQAITNKIDIKKNMGSSRKETRARRKESTYSRGHQDCPFVYNEKPSL